MVNGWPLLLAFVKIYDSFRNDGSLVYYFV